MQGVIHLGMSPCSVRTVKYIGTDELHTGYALCYHVDVGTATAKDCARANEVEQPNSVNACFFAGVVHPSCDGMVGPCQIDIIEPGSWADVYTDQTCVLAITSISATIDSYAFGAAYWGYGRSDAAALQTVDRSSTPGLVYAKLLDGAETCCGGEGQT